MSYFPVALKLNDKRVLLVGGGSIASFKLKKLKLFNLDKLVCVSIHFSEEFKSYCDGSEERHERSFDFSDLDHSDLVIVAIDDPQLQREIYQKCQEKRILCNCVDLLDCCDFIFPSIVKRGDITIAITSNGLVPGFSAVLREYLEKMLPPEIEKGFLQVLEIRKSLPAGKERMKLIRQKATEFFDNLKEINK